MYTNNPLTFCLCRFRLATVNNGLSLKSLAADLLNVSLDKSLELRCSDWEADQLTLEQVVIHCYSTRHICHVSHFSDLLQ